MRSIGVRELKTHLSQALRLVQEQGEAVEITHRGQVIARLVPATDVDQPDFTTTWTSLDQLAAEIGAEWEQGVGAAEAVDAQRREL